MPEDPFAAYQKTSTDPFADYQKAPDQPHQAGFFESLVNAVNPIPGIKEWWNRPAEIGKMGEALKVLHAAVLPEDKGKLPAQQRMRALTPEEQATVDAGMTANSGTAEPSMVHPVLAPAVQAGSQAAEGNLAGAAGTLAGGYGVPAAIGGAASQAPAVIEAARTPGTGQMVAGGGAMLGGAAALTHEPVAGVLAIAKGAEAIGKGLAARKVALAEKAAAAEELAKKQASDEAVARSRSNPREPVWAGMPDAASEATPEPAMQPEPQLPSGRIPGGPNARPSALKWLDAQKAKDITAAEAKEAPANVPRETAATETQPNIVPKEQSIPGNGAASKVYDWLQQNDVSPDSVLKMTEPQWDAITTKVGASPLRQMDINSIIKALKPKKI